MVTDPLGDLLIQIKNASLAGVQTLALPYSKLKITVCKILVSEGYISSVEKNGLDPKASLTITIKYQGKVPAITNVKRISKPGMRVYVAANRIPTVVGGMGTSIVSTSAGIMTGKDAKRKKLGGELLCEIW